jgi:hypothetical protein
MTSRMLALLEVNGVNLNNCRVGPTQQSILIGAARSMKTTQALGQVVKCDV